MRVPPRGVARAGRSRLHELLDHASGGTLEGSVAGVSRSLQETLRGFARLDNPEDDVVMVVGTLYEKKAAGKDILQVGVPRGGGGNGWVLVRWGWGWVGVGVVGVGGRRDGSSDDNAAN